MALVAMLLAPASADLFATSWPHFALTSVLSFIVAHSLARSYDLEGAVHASLFDFVIKPAVLTCAATTFSYGVEAWLGHSAVDGGAAFSFAQLSPEHYVIVFATLAMAGERLLGYGLLNRWQAAGHLSTSVVVFGADAIGQRLVKVVREDYPDSVSVVGVFDDRVQRVPGHVQGIPVDGGIDALIEFVKATPAVDKVLIALPMSAEGRILQLLTKLRSLAVDVALVPDFVGMRLDKQIARDGSPPILSVLRKPQSELDWLVKRSFDFATSLGLLIALSPLLALTALAIRLDSPGPILFRQPRLGLNNKEFNVLKFRSMYVEQSDLEAREQTKRNDAARDAGRRLAAPLEYRRAAAAVQRARRRHVAGGPAAARPRHAGEGPAVRRDRARIRRAPSHAAGHHRLGAGARPARRGRRAGAAGGARQPRHLLHRQLVVLLRSADPGDDGGRIDKAAECVLMLVRPCPAPR